jgi:hypothetical protein
MSMERPFWDLLRHYVPASFGHWALPSRNFPQSNFTRLEFEREVEHENRLAGTSASSAVLPRLSTGPSPHGGLPDRD